MKKKMLLLVCYSLCFGPILLAQLHSGYNWSQSGNGYYAIDNNAIVLHQLPANTDSTIATSDILTPSGAKTPLQINDLSVSEDGTKFLIFTNTQRVWRYHTRGDYWLFDATKHTLIQVGKGLPVASLMYAKISPDGQKVAYSSQHNMYVENISDGKRQQLTFDGTARMINGTFDWVYEEEFGCRDGFRWSPDSKSIAYWQVDATKIKNFLMINNTDSIYSYTIPVEYPVVGEDPSAVRIGVVRLATGKTTWMKIPGDAVQHYLPRMEFASNNEIVLQQLNRKQNHSILFYADINTGAAKSFYEESDNAWIDIKSRWHDDNPVGWNWLKGNKTFLWVSEKDGWRHVYTVSSDGKKETLVTKGNYDIVDLKAVDEKSGYLYFTASPDNATQQYLFKTRLDGKGSLEKISPVNQQGTHDYDISPDGRYAEHRFSNANTFPIEELIDLSTGKRLDGQVTVLRKLPPRFPQVEFTKITTADHVTMDAWVVKPLHFDSTKKYPVVFYVYSEPGSTTVKDEWGNGRNFLYQGDMPADGYVYVSIDGRGTPSLKGRDWRKSIYQKVGILNVHDQAEAAKKVLQWSWIDTSRVAVWGWSGGGSTTLHLMFEYPDIYKTGIAVAPVANRLTYDNIYEERYMGLVQENKQPYIDGSAIHHAQGLQGNLLLVHGTGDDNVHYQNSEMLINELVKYNKLFQFMSYPNRTHSISEGEGTREHLSHLYTNYLKANCAPGGK